MPSLKEVKTRIATVQTTRKITQARGVVSSALLVRCQSMLTHARHYMDALAALPIPAAVDDSPLFYARSSGPAAIVVAAGAAGMAGAFNSRMEKKLAELIVVTPGEKRIYPLGRKMREAVRRLGLQTAGEFDALAGKPVYDQAAALAATLIAEFMAGHIRSVDMLWYDFHTTSHYDIVQTRLLPLPFPDPDAQAAAAPEKPQRKHGMDDMIVEPSPPEVAEALMPLLLKARFWQNVLSTAASEHAARMIAMRGATDNADRLLGELQLSYNKLRQQNITSELLDIIGSSFA